MPQTSDLETPKGSWFAGLLDRAAKVDLVQCNDWMLIGIVVSGALFSLELWYIAAAWFGCQAQI